MTVLCDSCRSALGTEWTVALPVPLVKDKSKPLTLNDRLHHLEKARVVRQIRYDAARCVQAAKVPPLKDVTVQLVVTPPDAIRRDVDSLVATSKPAVDGLRDAGVLEDDSPEHVNHLMPRLTVPGDGWALALHIVGTSS